MSVAWTKGALKQLWAAHDWIEKENPTAAYEFLEAVTALVDLLGEFPGMGVQTGQPGVFMFPLVRYRYLIFFRVVRRKEVRIIRIRHASRKRPT
jgi:plasmid stabilization system protein ParE